MSPPVDPATRLRAEHVALDERFSELCRHAESKDWPSLGHAWNMFAEDLRAHFAYEEHDLFLPLARDRPALVAELRAQHDALRRGLDELGAAIVGHRVAAALIEAFVARLRHHAAQEHQELYPWLDRAGRQSHIQ